MAKQKRFALWLVLVCFFAIASAMPAFAVPTAPQLPELTPSVPEEAVVSEAPVSQTVSEAGEASAGGMLTLAVGVGAWVVLLAGTGVVVAAVLHKKKHPKDKKHKSANRTRLEEKFSDQHYRRY